MVVPGIEGFFAAAVPHPANGVVGLVATDDSGAAITQVNSSGVVAGPWALPGMQRPTAVAVDDGLGYLAIGEDLNQFGSRSPVIVRLLSSGAPDPEFGTAGQVVLPAGEFGTQSAGGLTLDESGRVLVTVRERTRDVDPSEPIATRMWRLLPNGAVDESFGQSGSLIVSTSEIRADAIPCADLIFVRPDGRILVVSRARGAQMVRQFLPNGEGLDSTFGIGGSADFTGAGLPYFSYAPQIRGGVLAPDGSFDEGTLFFVAADSWNDTDTPPPGSYIVRLGLDGKAFQPGYSPLVTRPTYLNSGAPIRTPSGVVLMGWGTWGGTSPADARYASGFQAYDQRSGIPYYYPYPAGLIEVAGRQGAGLDNQWVSRLPVIPVRGVGGAYYALGRQIDFNKDPATLDPYLFGPPTVAKLKSDALPSTVFG